MRYLMLYLAALLIIVGGAFAQNSPIDKGSFMLTGQASYTSLGGDLADELFGESMNLIIINPGIGYFISEGFMIGGDVAILSASWGEDEDVSFLGFGPTIGYYFNTGQTRTKIKGAFYPYIKGFFQMQSISLYDADASNFMFGGKVGFDAMLTNSVAIDAGITFSKLSFDPDGPAKSVSGNILSIGAGLTQFIW